MAEETVNPAQPETVEVKDVATASNALENFLDFGDEPEQPENDSADDQPEDETVTQETETDETEVEVANDDDGDEEQSEEMEVAEDEEVETPTADDLYEVTLPGGVKAQVTLGELSRGYSREADYTRKTESLAAQRRELAAERQGVQEAVENERAQYAQSLAQMSQALGNEISGGQEIDWDTLKEEDPIEFATQWADHQRKTEQFRNSQAQLQQMNQEQQQQQQQQYQVGLEDQARQLKEIIPEFKDETSAKKLQTDMRSFLSNSYGGFSEQEIGQIADARHVQLIHDAMKWKNLQSSKVKVEKKVTKLPRIIKGSAPKGRADVDQEQMAVKMKRAKQSGHVNDAAAAIADLIQEQPNGSTN